MPTVAYTIPALIITPVFYVLYLFLSLLDQCLSQHIPDAVNGRITDS